MCQHEWCSAAATLSGAGHIPVTAASSAMRTQWPPPLLPLPLLLLLLLPPLHHYSLHNTAPAAADAATTAAAPPPASCVESTIATYQTQANIPSLIWSYWDNPVYPPVVTACIDTWYVHAKNWKIYVLNTATMFDFVESGTDVPATILSEIPQHQSDMLSAALLRKYGGVWLDATVVMTGPIEFLRNTTDWFSYHDVGQNEINIMASVKRGQVVNVLHSAWLRTFDMQHDERMQLLGTEYNVAHKYLYSQHVLNYIYRTNRTVRGLIDNNSLNQWNTVYRYLHYVPCPRPPCTKADAVKWLMTTTSTMPLDVSQQPLHKIQGGASTLEYKVSPNSWWFQWTNGIVGQLDCVNACVEDGENCDKCIEELSVQHMWHMQGDDDDDGDDDDHDDDDDDEGGVVDRTCVDKVPSCHKIVQFCDDGIFDGRKFRDVRGDCCKACSLEERKRQNNKAPACVQRCIKNGRGCRGCVTQLVHNPRKESADGAV
jgi:hypothetical protein